MESENLQNNNENQEEVQTENVNAIENLDLNNLMKAASSILKSSEVSSNLSNLNGNLNLSSNLGMLNGLNTSSLLQGVLGGSSLLQRDSVSNKKMEEMTTMLNQVVNKIDELQSQVNGNGQSDMNESQLSEILQNLSSLQSNTISSQQTNLLFKNISELNIKMGEITTQLEDIQNRINKIKKKK